VLPEAFGMVAAEAASCGVVPVVSNHSGLAEVAAGLGAAGRTFDGTVPGLVGVLDSLLALPAAERRALGLLGRKQVQERWSWEGIGARLLEGAL
jgi:glycosyltransferase involved in cell wall biosynthesis